MIVWLELNRIKKAPQSLSNQLKNTNSKDWYTIYCKYKDGLGCPVLESKIEELQWILGYAVQIETQKNSMYLLY